MILLNKNSFIAYKYFFCLNKTQLSAVCLGSIEVQATKNKNNNVNAINKLS